MVLQLFEEIPFRWLKVFNFFQLTPHEESSRAQKYQTNMREPMIKDVSQALFTLHVSSHPKGSGINEYGKVSAKHCKSYVKF